VAVEAELSGAPIGSDDAPAFEELTFCCWVPDAVLVVELASCT
jgi:hypothetical protein